MYMSKLVSNSPFPGQSGRTKQVESLGQIDKSLGQSYNGKRKGTEPLYQSGKGDKKTGKRHPKRGKDEK